MMRNNRGFTSLERKRRRRWGSLSLTGFTLVELLVSASLFAVLMIGLVSFFRSGILSYARIDESLMLTQEAAKVFDRLSLDLKNSFPFSGPMSRFNGTSEAMSFFTLADVYENASLVRKYTHVSYVYSDHKFSRLTRRDKASVDEKIEPVAEEMASNVDACIFSYGAFGSDGKTFIWKSTWEDFKSMPVAVRINMTVKGKEKMEFGRTIYLISWVT